MPRWRVGSDDPPGGLPMMFMLVAVACEVIDVGVVPSFSPSPDQKMFPAGIQFNVSWPRQGVPPSMLATLRLRPV